MSTTVSNKKLKSIVRNLLETNSHKCRDYDLNLSYLVLLEFKPDISSLTVQQLFQLMNKGEVPRYDSITRCRRRLQQLYPELRGENYIERITVRQEEKKKELGYGTRV